MNKHTLIPNGQHRQAGLTLVELMVAMVISLFLIAGTITIFLSNKQAYRLNEASSRVQENSRFALDFMRRDVRMAGYVGCLSKNLAGNLNNVVDPAGLTGTDIKNIVSGFDGTNSLKGYTIPSGGLVTTGDLYINGLRTDTTNEGQAVPSTDAFIVTQGNSCEGGSVAHVLPGTSAAVQIVDAGSCGIIQQSVVMISDCEKADLFRVVNNPVSGGSKDTLAHSVGGSLNTQNTLSKAYGLDADVYTLTTSIYYIGHGASGEPSLFRRRYSGAAGNIQNEELVEGVESMVVTYGIDTDGDGSANFYANATSVDTTPANWARVNSARIRLVVRSAVQNVVQSTTNTDRRLRHTFTETIKVRNKI